MDNYIFCVFFLLIIFNCKSEHESTLNNAKEQDYFITTTEQLKQSNYVKKIDSLYDSGSEGYFRGRSNIKIYYKFFEQSKPDKAIVISSGRTEVVIKYKELIYDLFMNGYSIYIHDHRGQGMSGRMTPNTEMGYIDSFQYYIDDMKYFYDNFVESRSYTKKYLLAHSMGGAIGMTYLQQYPYDFNASSFSSPMLGFKPGICSIVNLIDKEQPNFAIGQTEYNDQKNDFEDNALTGSKIRYDRMLKVYQEHPKARLGGVTYTWLRKSCEQFEYLFKNIENIETPFILFSGENEDIVNARAHFKFIDASKALGKTCEYLELENAQHELFIETDSIRKTTLYKTLDYFSSF